MYTINVYIKGAYIMIRTQIYINQQESTSLSYLAKNTGKSQSEMIREAIDMYCSHYLQANRIDMLRKAKGLWKNRKDLPDFEALRKEMDRDKNE
jgi:predicted DNA-binding protein